MKGLEGEIVDHNFPGTGKTAAFLIPIFEKLAAKFITFWLAEITISSEENALVHKSKLT